MRIGLASNSGLFASGYQRLLDMGATAWVEPTCTQTIQQADGVNPDVTTWNKSPAGMGATGGQADPDGGNNAYLITDTVDGGGVFHSITDTTPNAQPGYVRRVVWLKAGTQNYSYVMGGTSGGTSNASIFNITGAAATYNQGSGVGRHLEFVGDWRKFLFTETPDAAMRARNIPVQAGTTNHLPRRRHWHVLSLLSRRLVPAGPRLVADLPRHWLHIQPSHRRESPDSSPRWIQRQARALVWRSECAKVLSR